MSNFAHLHLHTQYSLLDGLNKISPLLDRAAELGQPGVAITDHGNMHGALEFYEAAKKTSVKPIIGCELYVTDGSRFERKSKNAGGAATYHLTALAMNYEGYQNLCRLVTRGFREGFYFKPRVDHELLKQYSKGICILSGCLASEVGQLSAEGRIEELEKRVEFYAQTFGDNYYLEIQPHKIAEQVRLNEVLVEFSKRKGLPLVATTDCHYLGSGDHYAQEVLMCISTGKTVTDPDRLKHDGVALHLKSESEMLQEFSNTSYASEAIANTRRIVEQSALSFSFDTYHMPRFVEGIGAENPQLQQSDLIELMRKKSCDGLNDRLEEMAERDRTAITTELRNEYDERLEEELDLIAKMGFAGYFLVVSDFIVWAKEHDIPVGPGRGSAAGSLVAFCLYITDIDPIKHKLLFERFLNPERVSLPDIDVDFCIFGREKVIQYVVEKYGKENVAQIATFGTLKAKAALKDVGRALGLSYAETDRVAKLVPAPRQGFDYSLNDALKMEPRLKEYAEGEGRELIQLAMKMEGLTRHSSTHAAGLVIGDQPLENLLPLMVDKEGNDVTQFSMKYVEKIGLVKFDFLGLKTLTVIHAALRFIEKSRGERLDLSLLPLDDSKTFETLCRGETTGVFQLESSGIKEMTVRLKPSNFDDLVATIALYRPGPLDSGMAEHYIERKHGREPVSFLHPLMENSLTDTYGIILYQEQIMELARTLAGYSLAEADLLRRAMGKKIPEEMAQQKDRFISGAVEKGIATELAKEIFSQMETFARYGFNRSHSAAYALISYQTAYLKTHYCAEFFAALMTSELDDSDKTFKNLAECKRQNIAVLPPDVNNSEAQFVVREGAIRYGLSAVKGVGEKAANAIVLARAEGGEFKDFEDFCERVELRAVNRKVLENLIKCGAFDCSGMHRRELQDRMDEVLKFASAMQTTEDTSQMGLFGASEQPRIRRRVSNLPEWPVNQKLAYEREALGFYLSGHPAQSYERLLRSLGAVTVDQISALEKTQELVVGGVVTALKLKNTKRGDRYASFILEDWMASIEAIVWPDVYKQVAQIISSSDPLFIQAKAEVNDERVTLVVTAMQSLLDVRALRASAGVLSIDNYDDLTEKIVQLSQVLSRYPGAVPLKARIDVQDRRLSVVLRDEDAKPICVEPSEELCNRIEELFGKPVLTFS